MSRQHPEQGGGAISTLLIKPLASGVRVVVDLTDHAVCLNIFHDRFELNELDFVERSIGTGEHVIDVGANVGYFALSMAHRVGPTGSVVAIEPSPPAVRCLRLSIDENAFGDRMTVIEAAAGSQDGEARFLAHRHSTNGGSGFVLEDAAVPVPELHSASTVPLVRLDTCLRRRPVTFLKLDVEGSELNVLSGADTLLREDRPVILAELDPFCLDRVSRIRPRDLIDFMRKRRYVCHRLGAGTPGPRIDDWHADATEPVVFLPER